MGRNVGGELLSFLVLFCLLYLSALTRSSGCRNFKIDVEQTTREARIKEEIVQSIVQELAKPRASKR